MSVNHSTETYVDADGIEIFVRVWRPDGDPHAAVQIAHGLGEHSGRYDRLGAALAAEGFVVFADDHRGHGETGKTQWGGDLSKLGQLGPGGLRATEAAISQLAGIIRERYPELSLGLFAHSWGSMMAQRLLERWEGQWDAIVLSGSAYRLPGFMNTGAFNKRWAKEPNATGFEWLSRDTSVGAAFLDDPFNFSAENPIKLFGLADSARLMGRPRASNHSDIPMLIIGGTEDPVALNRSLQRLADAYRKVGVRVVTLSEFPEARHELINETEPTASEAITLVADWFGDKLK